MMKKRALLPVVLAGSAALLAAARAEDQKPEGGIPAAFSELAAIDSELTTWARSEPVDSDVRRTVLDNPPLSAEVPAPDPSHGAAYEAAAQNVLSIVEQRLSDFEAKVRRRELELIYGATAPPETPPVNGDPADEQLDVRSLQRSGTPQALPFVGIPLAGLPANDDRMRGEELECDPERLQDLITCELSEEQGATVDTIDGMLSLHATRASLDKVRATVERLRQIAERRVQVDLRAFRMTRALRAEVARLSDGVALTAEAEKRLAAEAVLVGEETLVTACGRVARSWRGEARAYVAEVAGTGSGSLETAARTLRSGIFAELVPRVDPGEKTATVSVRFSLVAPRAATRARAFRGELELPEVEMARSAVTATIPLGRAALVGGSFEGPETPTTCVLAVRPVLLASARASGETRAPAPAPSGERALVSLDKETKAEVARLNAILPGVARALAKVRLARERHVEVLDVRDLVVADTGALSFPRLGIASELPAEDETPPSGMDPERLLFVLRRATGGDESWVAPAWLGYSRGALIVRHTPGTLAGVARIVDSFRKTRRGLVEVEASLYRAPPALASTLANTLSPEMLLKLDDAVARGAASVVAGTFLVTRLGERSTVFAGRERAYVSGFAPLPSGASASTVTLARTGFRVGVRARREQGRIALEIDASSARLRDLGRLETANGPVFEPALDLDVSDHDLLLDEGSGFGFVRSRRTDGATVLVVRARSL